MYWLNIPLSLVAIWLVWTLTADENRGKRRNNDLHDFIVLTRNYDPSHRQHIDCVVDFYNSTNASSGGRIIPYGRKCDIFDYNLVFNSLVAKGLEVFYKTCLERAGKVADSFDMDQGITGGEPSLMSQATSR